MMIALRLLLKTWRIRHLEMTAFSRHRWFATVPQWTDKECEALHEFAKSQLGQKLITHLYAECHAQDRAASLQTKRHEHAAGWACGFRAAVGTIEVLAAVIPKDDESEDAPDQGERGLDHLTP